MPKRGNAPNVTRNRGASISGQETVVARITRERDEALLREAANSEILRLISRSPGDLELVFRTILEHATRICNANFGTLYRFDGEIFHPAAQFNTPAKLLEAQTRRGSFEPTPGGAFDNVMRTKQVFHSPDDAAEPVPGSAAKFGGARSLVAVPMLKDDAVIGIILIYRQEVRPFTDKQIELVKNFAAQAVIAIENTRLLSELRESLQQQTATADVLRVISSSPGELAPVFEAMLRNAVRICDAQFGNLVLLEGDGFRFVAQHGAPEKYRLAREREPFIRSSTSLNRVLKTKQILHIADIAAENPHSGIVTLGGARTLINVPMLKETVLIGIIVIYRQEVRAFTEKQIELLKNFAAQAVIAIENSRLLNELRHRTTDLGEALEQQTATSEVLKVISSSPGELEGVFRAILENATRICEAKFGTLYLREGEGFRTVAAHNAPPAYIEARTRELIRPPSDTALGRVATTQEVVHIADVKTIQSYIERNPFVVTPVELGGYRTVLAVPMLKNNELIGVITINRQEVQPFTDKQIELVTNFATQAVIAIENTRLLNELRESLDRQTATAEVLRVVSSSPGQLEPVFQAMLENATRICDAEYGILFSYDGRLFNKIAARNVPSSLLDFIERRGAFLPPPETALHDMLTTRNVAHRADASASPVQSAPVRLGGAKAFLAVPMFKDEALVGAIAIYRQEARPFTEKQIALVQNFAAQAVIAIENTRLLDELRQRTTDLTESLEQQTATSEVLRVISSSPGELKPVFNAMLENAVRLCEAEFGHLFLYDGEAFQATALHSASQPFTEVRRRPVVLHEIHPDTPLARMARTKAVVHIADVRTDKSYIMRDDPVFSEFVDVSGARTDLLVPMLKENELVGAFVIYRLEVRPFTDKQIELLKNFAAQAVIAIENARLLNELRKSLGQQTATSKVLEVISSSPGELKPVFEAILENAVRLCEAKFGNLYLREDDGFRAAAIHNAPRAYAEQRAGIVHPSPYSTVYRAVQTKQPAQIADITELQAYVEGDPWLISAVSLGGYRGALAVPMLHDDEVIGAITIFRQEAGAFADKQIELLTNFAKQAVIAIENARLLNELRQSLEQQTATADVLGIISSSPGELEPVFQAMLENAARICEAKFGNIYRWDTDALRLVATHNTPAALAEVRRRSPVFGADAEDPLLGRMITSKTVMHVADAVAEPAYVERRSPVTVAGVELGGIRTALAVPMLKENELIGAITLFRQEVRPFTDKQIALVRTFADQAAIAIENVQLLKELRQRTEELGRSVEELRALSEVSQAVNSTLDLQNVLSTIVAKAAQLSGTEAGAIYVFDELHCEFRLHATYGMDRELIDALTQRHIGLDDPNVREALAQPEPIQVADLKEEAPSDLNEITLHAGFRARLVAPLLRGEDIVGMLVVRRRTPGEFAKNTVDIIKTFAAQSALAIQNARLFHEIQDKSQQLEVASQHKSEFLANMSHELRTPLNAILGYTELMADGAYGEPSEKMLGILKRLEANGKHLLGLINDVLDLSKIEAGQLVLELSDYCIQDIAQTVRSTLEPLAADKKLGFKVEIAPQLPPGRGDGRRLTQVLINLVGNAIKFTDAGEVAINAEAKNGSFHVSVRDTGPGISSADQARLFQEFQQADNAITRKKGGTGLGLAISKRIIEMHGGRIWVESQPGQGSTFAFTLPVIVERQVNVESD